MTELDEEIVVSFPLSATEEARALKASFGHGPPSRFAMSFVVAFTILTIVQIVLAANSGVGIADIIEKALPPAVVAVLAAMFPRHMPLRYYREIVRRMSSAVGGTLTRTFSKDGLFTAGPNGAEFLRWESLSHVVETKEFLLFYLPSGKSHYVPKYALPLEAEERLREFIGTAFSWRPERLKLMTPND